MKKDIRIIALDLDGTLLDSQKRLSEANRAALAAAAEKGILVVPTTGRFFGMMPAVVRDLPFVRYAITVNGAEVYDRVEDKVIAREEIPRSMMLSTRRMEGADDSLSSPTSEILTPDRSRPDSPTSCCISRMARFAPSVP